MRAAKPAWCSTVCTSSTRRASHRVLAPDPNSKTRIGRGRAASHASTLSIAAYVHQGTSSSAIASESWTRVSSPASAGTAAAGQEACEAGRRGP
jgi:hypothetical protein